MCFSMRILALVLQFSIDLTQSCDSRSEYDAKLDNLIKVVIPLKGV